ncbi:SirB2 family protein [Ferrimonas marina]|uniref:Uncharacterized membrane protein SirB2 n=1 Tax=Ferrimonas marina TaxID=299255 RepID=A0A1M5SCI7_9GAMM|nr:SirB2 family protein [Ferrimonas marina]SHH36160.1 Uncharacterized membrane protein SirB2 [Ferrimonas marina]
MPYVALKHIHLTLIGASVGLFILRFVLLMLQSGVLQRKWAKVLPHVIDTLLLLSGVALIMATGWNPIRDPWLTEKMLALVAYIILGVITFKAQRGTLFRVFAFLGSLGWVYYMFVLAQTKTPLLLG